MTALLPNQAAPRERADCTLERRVLMIQRMIPTSQLFVVVALINLVTVPVHATEVKARVVDGNGRPLSAVKIEVKLRKTQTAR